MDWFRSHHGAPTDPKWLTVARRAGVLPGQVASVVWALFDHASQNHDRGSIAGVDTESIADFYGYSQESVEAVITALRDKGVLTADRFTTWDRRQPKREDPDAGERKRQQREREKAQRERDKPEKAGGGRDEAGQGHTSHVVTHGHAPSGDVTLDKRRVEEEETPPPPSSGTTAGAPVSAARVVAERFLALRIELWPTESRFPAPRTTLETEASQHLAGGASAELVLEVLERGMRNMAERGLSPPGSLKAFGNSLHDAVVRQAEADAPTAPRRRNDVGSAVAVLETRDPWFKERQRLRTYRENRTWNYGSDPPPTSGRCQIPLNVIREELGDAWIAANRKAPAGAT